MNNAFAQLQSRSLVWLPERGVGFHPAPPIDYAGDYWAEYQRRADTDIGRALTAARVELVRAYYKGDLVDVGIGAGSFVEARRLDGSATYGCDINPHAVDWLGERGWLWDPWQNKISAASFWDSLEHIPDPAPLLANIRKWCFVSLPIFVDGDHVLASKHYKPGEHVWYFTRDGFLGFMADHGFRCVDESYVESEIGREDIMSFAFQRVPQ